MYFSKQRQTIININKMGSYLKRVILISIVAMLFAAISNANLGIISQFASQNGNKWVGPLSIALIFLGSGAGALYNKYIGKYKYRVILVCGAMGWNIFLTFSVMFLFIGFSDVIVVVILGGSLLCGLLMSAYYNGLNNFINECGKYDNKTNSYFGINICIVQVSNIVGNGLSAILIKPLGQKAYSFIMLGLNILISLLYLLTQQFPRNNDQLTESIIERQQDQTIKQVQKKGKIPKLLYFIFAFSGIMISFVYSQFSIAFYKYFCDMQEEQLNKLTFETFIIEGCGQFAGGLFLALFATRMNKVVLFNFINNLLFIGSVVVIWQGFQLNQIWIIKLAAFTVGFADCFGFALALAVSGKWSESGISLFNFGQSSTVAILSTLYIFVEIQYALIIYGVYMVITTLASIQYREMIDDPQQNKETVK